MRGEKHIKLYRSPFTVHVSEGQASAVGSPSLVTRRRASRRVGFIAGEHVFLRPQVRDA